MDMVNLLSFCDEGLGTSPGRDGVMLATTSGAAIENTGDVRRVPRYGERQRPPRSYLMLAPTRGS
jgi:hypothetical protein